MLDASAALRWCFRDEATVESDLLLALVEKGDIAYVPSHWPLEVLNGLVRATRRGRATDAAVDTYLASLKTYRLAVDTRSAIDL